MIPDRAPNSIWCLSRANLDVYVTTGINDQIQVVGPAINGATEALYFTRKDARQLAKRINQCLDATVKR